MRPSGLLCAALVAASLLVAQPAFAGGSLAFLGTPTTVNAGAANSFMNLYSDCRAACPEGPAPELYALPTQTATLATVTTSSTPTDLVLRFTLPDATQVPNPSTGIGERIIVQLDPDGSRGTVVQVTDFRFEITIKGGLITNALRRPGLGTGGWDGNPQTNWCPSTAGAASCTNTQGTVTISTVAGVSYDVRLTIPLASVGITTTTANFGIALLMVNDIMHTVGSRQDLTAVTFPSADMPASSMPYSDPGVVNTVNSSGPWITPSSWGTGYFQPPTGGPLQVTLSQVPAPWLANAIRLSYCDAPLWNDVGAAALGVDQATLANWYLYERDNPCKMGVWVKANNAGVTTAGARLLVMWADPGLSTNNWRVVQLTPPIAFTPGESTFRVMWDRVPYMGSMPGAGSHPCVRVYVVPEVLNATDPTTSVLYDDAAINAINDGAKLAAFERAYGFPPYPWNPQVAQMNFTNLATGSCSRGLCVQPGGPFSEWRQFLFASLGALGPRPAYAQTPAPRRLDAIRVTKDGPGGQPGRNDPFAIVSIQGYAVPDKPAKQPYEFLEPMGGVAWAVPLKLLAKQPLKLGFTVGNPALLHREFANKRVKEIAAPPRRILLAARVDAPKDAPRYVVKLPTVKGAMKPGEVRRVVATVSARKEPAKKPH